MTEFPCAYNIYCKIKRTFKKSHGSPVAVESVVSGFRNAQLVNIFIICTYPVVIVFKIANVSAIIALIANSVILFLTINVIITMLR
jgi:hypothetical protein